MDRCFAKERDALLMVVKILAAGVATKAPDQVRDFEVELLEAVSTAGQMIGAAPAGSALERREAIHAQMEREPRRRPLTPEQLSAGYRWVG